jgi:hypothetical protein
MVYLSRPVFGGGIPQDTPPAILAGPPAVGGTAPLAALPATGGYAPPVVGGGIPPAVAPVNSNFMNQVGLGIRSASDFMNRPLVGNNNPVFQGVSTGFENLQRGLTGQGPAPSPVAPPQGPMNIEHMRGRGLSITGVPTTNAPNNVPGPPAPPAAPVQRGFSNVTPASAAAIAAFLPRQRMPQEIAGQGLLAEATRQRDAILKDAASTPAQRDAATANYANLEKEFALSSQLAMMQEIMRQGQGIQ